MDSVGQLDEALELQERLEKLESDFISLHYEVLHIPNLTLSKVFTRGLFLGLKNAVEHLIEEAAKDGSSKK